MLNFFLKTKVCVDILAFFWKVYIGILGSDPTGNLVNRCIILDEKSSYCIQSSLCIKFMFDLHFDCGYIGVFNLSFYFLDKHPQIVVN